MEIPVLYQDNDVVVVNKRSGLLVHRSGIDPHATEFAVQIVRDAIGKFVYPVHRLDRATSGALIFALTKENAQKIASQFAQSTVTKTYLAVVRGYAPDFAVIDHPLREELDAITDKWARTDKAAQVAQTEIKALDKVELPHQVDKFPTTRYSLVKATPKTGRKHQIRRHLRHLGHPIVGDINYGVGKHNRFFETEFGIRRLLLACTEIAFTHPSSNETVTVKAPLAEDFAALMRKLNWGEHV